MAKSCILSSPNTLSFDLLLFLLLTLIIIIPSFEKYYVWPLANADIYFEKFLKMCSLCICMNFNVHLVKNVFNDIFHKIKLLTQVLQIM